MKNSQKTTTNLISKACLWQVPLCAQDHEYPKKVWLRMFQRRNLVRTMKRTIRSSLTATLKAWWARGPQFRKKSRKKPATPTSATVTTASVYHSPSKNDFTIDITINNSSCPSSAKIRAARIRSTYDAKAWDCRTGQVAFQPLSE